MVIKMVIIFSGLWDMHCGSSTWKAEEGGANVCPSQDFLGYMKAICNTNRITNFPIQKHKLHHITQQLKRMSFLCKTLLMILVI